MNTKVFRRKNDAQILETWTPVIQSYGVQNVDTISWLSEYAHNHAIWDNSSMINESTPGLFFQQPGSISSMGNPFAPTRGQVPFPNGEKGLASNSGSGDKFPSLLPIAIQVAAKTIGFDLVSVIPMDSPVGFIPYLDYVYAGGKTDSAYPAFLIKLPLMDPSTASTGSPAETLSSVTAGTVFKTKNGGGVEQIDLRFVGFSRVDGAAVFRVKSMASGTIELAFTAGYTLVNIGTGEIYALTSNNNAVDLVSALENHISGFTSTDETMSDTWSGPFLPEASNGKMNVPGSMTRSQSEGAVWRQMGIKLFTKFVEADGDQVALSATIEQIQDFNRVWNFDVISMLENVGVNDIAQSINKRIVGRLFEMGYTHTDEIAKTEGAGLTTLSLDAGGGFENTSTLQRRVATKVLEMANLIYHRGRWGGGEYVVTNGRVAAALADIAGYTIASIPSQMPNGAGQLIPAGKVYGLTIYVDPNLRWGDNKMLIGRKGKDEEPGVKFLPYIMAESIQTISEGTFSPKLGIKSRYAITEAGWHPETQYITLEVNGINKIVAGAPAVA
jgi:hypothetical protein